MIIPKGAEPIIRARQNGLRPDELIIVSPVGQVGEANHTVYVNPDAEYDWRWAVGLDVCVYLKPGVAWQKLVSSIAKARPRWLGIYDMARFEGATVYLLPAAADLNKPKGQWRWQLEFLSWLPFQNKEFAWGA
jgi:hypothetical protein